MAISNEDLQTARMIAAEIVAKLGDKYWPIFDIIDREWSDRQARFKRLEECLKHNESFLDESDTRS
ncbi:hypothetical protein [Hyphomonas sp. ND6WE1B]|uniref:hypothetical protein n=1 Tax=Hyphomonas sp. ND6WE1B TaxID=1848191 RepID=UPI0011121C09|nr:hypothetical protein [Hyphomonas sp. ND6WE1B]